MSVPPNCRMGSVVGASLSSEELQERIDVVKEAVDVAVFMGAPLIRLFGGGVPEGYREP